MNSKTKQTQKMSGDKKVKISVAENKDEDESSKTRRDSSKGRLELLETKYRSLVCEKRLMLVMFLVTLLATLLFVISFSTPYWLWIALSKPQTRSDHRGAFKKLGHYHGLWRICRTELWPQNGFYNDSQPSDFCRPMYFSLPEHMKSLPHAKYNMELKMLDFRRSTIAVGFIALMMAFLSHTFTYFSLDQLRYMYKRLAGCLCLITGACSWVTLEVFRQMQMYEEKNMRTYVAEFADIHAIPAEPLRNTRVLTQFEDIQRSFKTTKKTLHTSLMYGWSYNLIWFVLVLYIAPGLVFLLLSKKKKRSKARSLKEARANEPVHLGR